MCLTTGGMAAAIAAGVTQVSAKDVLGVDIKLWALFLGAYSVGCNLLVGFLSQSFGDWKEQMKTSGDGSTLRSETVTVQTKNEPAAVPATPPAETKPGQ